MASNSTFISISSEGIWILEIDNNFPKEHVVDIDFDTPTCVFRVPKSLSETKPEDYAPQYLGMGPYHHLRPEFYKLQKQKISAVRKFLNADEKHQDFNRVVEALIKWEPVVRACYYQYLDFDIRTLARILAIDALYLMQLFFRATSEITKMEKQAGDIIMLENQIPVILLKKILQIILQLEEFDVLDLDNILFGKFQVFCYAYSPLRLNHQQQITEDATQLHLLHRLYYLIVTNRGISDAAVFKWIPKCSMRILDVRNAVKCLADRGVPGADKAEKTLSCIEKLPLDGILALFKKDGPGPDQQIPSVEEIDIPTVSQMSEAAGIKFKSTPGGIRDIKYVDDHEGEEKIFYLPSIRLDANTEIILRNLVAYEAASAKPGSTLELAE